MKVSDLLGNQLNPIKNEEKKINKMNLMQLKEIGTSNNDKIEIKSLNAVDLVKINDTHRAYMRNQQGLMGLYKLKSQISAWEASDQGESGWSNLSKEIKDIIHNTKFEGENVISYFDTPVTDKKSLYTLKLNIDSEIKAIQSKINNERKTLSMYLVSEQNRDSLNNSDNEKLLLNIIDNFKDNKANNIFNEFGNIGKLINNNA